MRVAFQRGFAHPAKKFAKGWIARQIAAQYERVHKSANQVFCFELSAARDRRANHDIVLSAIAKQQSLKSGQQGHEQGRAFAPAQRFDGPAEIRRQQQGLLRAVECARLWPPVISRELQRRGRICKFLLPVIHLTR